MIWPRSVWVIRRGRPGRGRSPSPSITHHSSKKQAIPPHLAREGQVDSVQACGKMVIPLVRNVDLVSRVRGPLRKEQAWGMNEESRSKRRRRGQPTVQIMLSDDERQPPQRWARRASSSQALALRCRIVLACAEGGSNGEVGEQLGVHPVTVAKWRTRFAARRRS
jgi:Homeodomain-like domain